MKKIIGILLLFFIFATNIDAKKNTLVECPGPVDTTYWDSSSPPQLIGYGNANCVNATGATPVGGVSCCGRGCYEE